MGKIKNKRTMQRNSTLISALLLAQSQALEIKKSTGVLAKEQNEFAQISSFGALTTQAAQTEWRWPRPWWYD